MSGVPVFVSLRGWFVFQVLQNRFVVLDRGDIGSRSQREKGMT